MIQIKSFIFNPYNENTYILYDNTNKCVIIDPGCHNNTERESISNFIKKNQLIPVHLLNTHCHIDHIVGNHFISNKYKLNPSFHKYDYDLLNFVEHHTKVTEMNYKKCDVPNNYLNENDIIKFGNSVLKVIYTPGHSLGSISFYSQIDNFIISGDTIFKGSIGRTDLFGGNFKTLITTIKKKIFDLNNNIKIYPGHGEYTFQKIEELNNIYIK